MLVTARRGREPPGPCNHHDPFALGSLPLLVVTCAGVALASCLGFLSGFQALLDALHLHALRMLQLQRITWFLPLLWALVFSLALATLCRFVRGGRFFVAAMIAAQLAVAVSAQVEEHRGQELTLAKFFSPSLFTEIRSHIGRPSADYRVACIGFPPSIALYNGFYTVDGYWVNYPFEYKRRFRRIIADELAKKSGLQTYFDQWGSRCYVFSAELWPDRMHTKNRPRCRIEHLDIGTAAPSSWEGNTFLAPLKSAMRPNWA